MENNIIDERIYKDLISQIDEKDLENTDTIIKEKRINIKKVIYDNKENFELHGTVKEAENSYSTYIKVAEGEIENLSCTCEEYKKSYCACKHIIGTVKEFINNPDYIRIFTGNAIKENKISIKEKEDVLENYKIFNQLVKEFYYLDEDEKENDNTQKEISGNIHIEPKLISSKFYNSLKLEIKIGEKQMYRVKSLPEFYDRFMEKEKYKYGAKLEFVHTKEKFAKEDQKLLDFVLKYSEIVKYANESSTGYDYYTKRIGEDAIIISNTGLDDLFDCLENRVVQVENQYSTDGILFVNKEPEIKFNLEQVNINEYRITTNVDVYDYMVYDGRRYEYVLIGKKLYRCS